MRSPPRPLLVLLMLLAATACARGERWQQEVRRADGRTLVVEHTATPTAAGEVRVLRFAHPGTAEQVRWELPRGTVAHLLDFDGPAAFLVLAAESAAAYNRWHCPNPPWIVYRHLAGVWMRMDLGALPTRFITPNLLPRPDDAARPTGRISPAHMASYLAAAPPAYRQIGRARLNPLAQGCQEYLLRQLGREQELQIGRPTAPKVGAGDTARGAAEYRRPRAGRGD